MTIYTKWTPFHVSGKSCMFSVVNVSTVNPLINDIPKCC